MAIFGTAKPVFTSVMIEKNVAGGYAGGVLIKDSGTHAEFNKCTIQNNIAMGRSVGGAGWIGEEGMANISSSFIRRNFAGG